MPEKILIIDDDLDTLRLVGLMLQKQGYQIVAAGSGPQGLELALSENPDLILLDVMMPGMDGYEVARRLRANEKTSRISILMFTAKSQLDDKVSGFEAGADDYLTKPTHPTELQAHVRALLARSNKGIPPVPSIEDPAYLIGVIGARGGLGVTTVASNLAASLAKRNNSSLILAEFRPGQGTLCYDLKIEPADGLNQLLNTPAAEISRKQVESVLVKHPSGVNILAASGQPKDAALMNKVEQFEVVLNRMKYGARVVIVDLGCGLGVLNQKLAPMFNELIIVAEPMEISLIHSRALLDNLIELGIDKSHLVIAVNYRLRSDAQLSVPQVQDKIKNPVDVTFTPAPELLIQAARRLTMASVLTMESLTAQQYNSLAAKIEARAPQIAKK